MSRTAPVVRVVLELLAGRQPLSGSVMAGDDLVIPFRGWLELAAAIERARLEHEEAQH